MPPGSKWLNTIDPIAYAFRALVPLVFHCVGGKPAGCPMIKAPGAGQQLVSVDRSDFVNETYELSYDNIWPSIGYTAIFIGVFQVLNIISAARRLVAPATTPRTRLTHARPPCSAPPPAPRHVPRAAHFALESGAAVGVLL